MAVIAICFWLTLKWDNISDLSCSLALSHSHLSSHFSPVAHSLSLLQDLAYQWWISLFNKSLLPQSPFPLVCPAWLVDLTHSSFAVQSLVSVCGRGCSAEWICVWRWQKTCLVTMGLGDISSSMLGSWSVRLRICKGAGWRFICTRIYAESWKCAWIERFLLYACVQS